jgi:formylglycine-generating enzyme required for sulfatase activity
MKARSATVAMAVAVASCGGLSERGQLPPEGQILLAVTTDAWLPPGPTEQGTVSVDRPALFEKLRIEFFAPGEMEPCRECVRDFGIDQRSVENGSASVGFVPQPGVSGYRVRVRIYHSGAGESAAEPRPSSSIEVVAALPPVAADGIVPMHVVLHTDDVGKPQGTLAAPSDANPGPPPRAVAGTWHADTLRGCSSPPRDGEACVPGGAFWMGDPGFTVPFERLVAVSPYFIDVREVSVKEVRASGLATLDTVALTADPYLYSADATKNIHYCTYTQKAADKEDLPVNCITRELARKVCAKRGADLPTEAQYEFVARARRGADFPWGEGDATCDDAVYGRSYDTSQPPPYHACMAKGAGVAPAGSGRLDRVRLGDREVVDLAGNLAEWTRDTYQTTDEPCFKANPVIDPLCTEPSAIEPTALLTRSSPWTDPGGSELRAAVRARTAAPQNPRVGFRCSRPDG